MTPLKVQYLRQKCDEKDEGHGESFDGTWLSLLFEERRCEQLMAEKGALSVRSIVATRNFDDSDVHRERTWRKGMEGLEDDWDSLISFYDVLWFHHAVTLLFENCFSI